MSKGLSLYLDLLRLLAALEVFVYHLTSFPAIGVQPAWWNGYGREAVTIFFVLSGFVIRHAAASGDRDVESFAASRLARVYSVAIPCLALTLIFDTIGHHLAPGLYAGVAPAGSPWPRLAIGAMMLNETWVSVQMLSNTPYWSLSYEACYYALFAALFYFGGRTRWLLAGACALIAGPRILLLFPIWLLGWWAYRERLSARLPLWGAALLFVQPAAMIAAYTHWNFAGIDRAFLESLLGHHVYRDDLAWSRYVLSDTVLGVSIAVHLLGARRLGDRLLPILSPFGMPIKLGAGQSFTLYLLHQPALLFAGACLAAVPLGAARGLAVAVATLLIVAIVAMATEAQRRRLKALILALFEHVRHVRRRSRTGFSPR
ncbi:MAG TPA: acyltransferase [Sphingomonas sp.]